MNDRPKVLFCHPGAELYGSDRMAVATVAALVSGGYEVVVVVPGEGPLVPRFRDAGATVFTVTLPVLRKALLKPGPFAGLTRSMPSVLRKARRLIRSSRADLVYVNTVTQPWWIRAANSAHRPCIVHVREAETGVPSVVQRALTLPLRGADAIVANSSATRDHVVSNGVGLARRTRVIYNGKDWGAYYRSPFDGFDGAVRILFIGRLNPRKGPDTAIEALARLVSDGRDARLILAGDIFPGYEWYADELRRLASDLGVADRCTFTGFVDDIGELLEHADVVVAPSRVEPFGTVAAEGMAAQRPTIVSDVQGLVEIVDDPAVGRVFPAGDSAALAAAIRSLLVDPDEAVRVARAGQQSVLERFSLSRYEEETIELVAGLLDPSTPPPTPPTPGQVVPLAPSKAESSGGAAA